MRTTMRIEMTSNDKSYVTSVTQEISDTDSIVELFNRVLAGHGYAFEVERTNTVREYED